MIPCLTCKQSLPPETPVYYVFTCRECRDTERAVEREHGSVAASAINLIDAEEALAAGTPWPPGAQCPIIADDLPHYLTVLRRSVHRLRAAEAALSDRRALGKTSLAPEVAGPPSPTVSSGASTSSPLAGKP